MLLLVLCSCTPKTEVTSPDGNIKWSFNLDEKGGMTYQVSVKNVPFINTSALGIEIWSEPKRWEVDYSTTQRLS